MKSKTNLLVTGALRIGKSSVVRKALAQFDGEYSGIFSEPLFERDRVVGYGLRRAGDVGIDVFAHKDWQTGIRMGPFECDLEPFVRAARYLEECLKAGSPLVIIDEIGVVENNCARYLAAVEKVLDSESVSLFVVQQRAAAVWKILTPRSDCEIFQTTRPTRDALPGIICGRLRNIGR